MLNLVGIKGKHYSRERRSGDPIIGRFALTCRQGHQGAKSETGPYGRFLLINGYYISNLDINTSAAQEI
jgi:hypothetical protein